MEIFKLRNRLQELEREKNYPLCVKCRVPIASEEAQCDTPNGEHRNLLQVIRA